MKRENICFLKISVKRNDKNEMIKQKFALDSQQSSARIGAVIDVTVKHLTLIEFIFVGQGTESVVELELKYVSNEVPGERTHSLVLNG